MEGSSEHSNFSFVTEENETAESIDQASQLFTSFTKKPPTLKEALASMKIGWQGNLLNCSQRMQQKN